MMAFHFRSSCLLYILSLVAGTALLDDFESDCGEKRENVESGIVRLPDTLSTHDNISCFWQYSAPPGRKLLVKVDTVKLLNPHRISSLQLFLNKQYYELPKNCMRCYREKLNAEVIQVYFFSIIDSSQFTESDKSPDMLLTNGEIGTFQIRFKAFDPLHCEQPTAPKNGFTIGQETNIGHKIKYGCYPPFDLVGASQSQCIIPRDLPVPVWSPTPPSCTMQNCSAGPIHRFAGTGAIAHPAYPTRQLFPNQHCQWIIEADANHRILMSITQLDVPISDYHKSSSPGFNLIIFDKDSPDRVLMNVTGPISSDHLNFTSKTNVVVVKMDTHLRSKVEGAFYLEYSASPIECPRPVSPSDGDIVVHSLHIGSTVVFRCNLGFTLMGDPHAKCLDNGQWSSSTPTCIPIPDLEQFNQTLQNETMDSGNTSSVDNPVLHKNQLRPKFKLKPKPTFKIQTKQPHPVKEEIATLRPYTNFSEQNGPVDKGGHPKKRPPGEEPEVPQQHASGKQSDRKSHVHFGSDPGGEQQQERPLATTYPLGSNFPDADSAPTVDLQISSSPSKARKKKDQEDLDDFLPPMQTIFIIAGVVGPLLLILIIIIGVVLYRKKYPVRMRFGRKFSTFENPMYVRKADAHSPRELSKLTETT